MKRIFLFSITMFVFTSTSVYARANGPKVDASQQNGDICNSLPEGSIEQVYIKTVSRLYLPFPAGPGDLTTQVTVGSTISRVSDGEVLVFGIPQDPLEGADMGVGFMTIFSPPINIPEVLSVNVLDPKGQVLIGLSCDQHPGGSPVICVSGEYVVGAYVDGHGEPVTVLSGPYSISLRTTNGCADLTMNLNYIP